MNPDLNEFLEVSGQEGQVPVGKCFDCHEPLYPGVNWKLREWVGGYYMLGGDYLRPHRICDICASATDDELWKRLNG